MARRNLTSIIQEVHEGMIVLLQTDQGLPLQRQMNVVPRPETLAVHLESQQFESIVRVGSQRPISEGSKGEGPRFLPWIRTSALTSVLHRIAIVAEVYHRKVARAIVVQCTVPFSSSWCYNM